jgi:hypothetical protein
MASLTALKFGDASVAHTGGHGRLLPIMGALAFVGPWVIVGDMVVETTTRELASSLSFMCVHSFFGLSLLLWASSKTRNTTHDYWIATAMIVTSFLVIFAIAASKVDHLNVSLLLDARTLLRLVSLHFAGISVASLRPLKAW